MKYLLIDKTTAEAHGFTTAGHSTTTDSRILINEREVVHNALLQGTFEQRCQQLEATPASLDDIRQLTLKQHITWQKPTSQRRAVSQ